MWLTFMHRINTIQISCIEIINMNFLMSLIGFIILSHVKANLNPKTNPEFSIQFPICQACSTVVSSIKRGMDKTNKKHFGGGDAAWEAEKLGNYARSEVRLMEVLEHLCSDVVKGQSQCYRLVEEWEEAIEKWWFDKKRGNLHDWLCINETKSCCPDDHFGPQCTPCPGYPDVCTNNGKCNGSGTREGNGKCICSYRYTGANCDKCADNFYEDRSDNYLFCLECNKACKGCTGARRENCIECNIGWEKNEKLGCVDINECKLKGTCKNNEYCLNNDGHFECLPCDKSCNRCHGIGPAMCDKCTTGYRLHYGVCSKKELLFNSTNLNSDKN